MKRVEKYFQSAELPTLKISQSAYKKQVELLEKYISDKKGFLKKDAFALIKSIFQQNPFVPEIQAYAKTDLSSSEIDSLLQREDFDSVAEFLPTPSLHVPSFKINTNSPHIRSSISKDNWTVLLQTIGHEYAHYLQWILISTSPTLKKTARKANDLKNTIFENFLTYQEVFDCVYYATSDFQLSTFLAENIACADYEKRKYEQEAESFSFHFTKKLLKVWKKTTSSKALKKWCDQQLLLCDKNKLNSIYVKQKNALRDYPIYKKFNKIINRIDYKSFSEIVATCPELLFTDNPFLMELESPSQKELEVRKDNFLRALMQLKKDEEYLTFFNTALKDKNYPALKFLISFIPSCASKPKSQQYIFEKLYQAASSQDKRTLLVAPQDRVKELIEQNNFDKLTQYLLPSKTSERIIK